MVAHYSNHIDALLMMIKKSNVLHKKLIALLKVHAQVINALMDLALKAKSYAK